MARGRSSGAFYWTAGFTGAALLNLLSLAGIADSVVEWRCFLQIDEIVATYQALKAFVFGLLPFRVPEWLRDYTIITGSFSLMLGFYGYLTEKRPVHVILAESEGIQHPGFAVILYLLPWIVLLWLMIRHVAWRMHWHHIRDWIKHDPEATAAFNEQSEREARKARVLVRTILGYPFACLALLFVFSDFAYTLLDTSRIAGISFREKCTQTEGEMTPRVRQPYR